MKKHLSLLLSMAFVFTFCLTTALAEQNTKNDFKLLPTDSNQPVFGINKRPCKQSGRNMQFAEFSRFWKFEVLSNFILQIGGDEEKEKQLKEKYQSSATMREFTGYASGELGMECPKDWTLCPDGSCTPPGTDCTLEIVF